MESDWPNGLQSLQKFADANGVIRIPGEYIDDNGFKLGYWVNNVLRSKKAGNLSLKKN